jgi:hypothetical protein
MSLDTDMHLPFQQAIGWDTDQLLDQRRTFDEFTMSLIYPHRLQLPYLLRLLGVRVAPCVIHRATKSGE